VLVGASSNADALAEAGFDLMGVATNHIKDCGIATCGDRAFFDTLANLRRVGLSYFGAGANQAEALQPVVVEVNGIRFGFVSAGDSRQGEWTFAGPDSPGIARLNSENIQAAIDAARKVADVVIFMPHWGPEDVSIPNWIQRGQAQEIVAAGADLVVGNHTHVVQAIQEIDGVPVFYGLGNFVFDQGLRDHRQGAILLVKFQGTQYLGYELIPTHVDPDGRVHIAELDEAEEILQRIEESSQAIR
jgi:poly-gamma-glutamate synthesis protein (capsule biosynthesis protein)